MDAASTLNDIVFEGRNRAYGAYKLRQLYRPTLTRAIGLGVGAFLLAVSALTLYTRYVDRNQREEVSVEVTLTKLPETPLEPEKQLELRKPEPLPAQNTVRNLPPEVLPEDEVDAPTLPPTVQELANAVSSYQTQAGTGDEAEIIAPPEETAAPTRTETALDVTPLKEDVFIMVEQQPEFPGGMAGLTAFLKKNLRYPQEASRANVSGKVFISFVVNTDGSLTEVQVLKGIGFGCDEEARRVVNQMPRWKPGRQSGRAVRVKFNLPITFTLE